LTLIHWHKQIGQSHFDNDFYSARNARIASAVLATAIPSVRLSACPSVTRRYCASTVRDRKRSSITLNKNSARAFQRAIHQGSTPSPNFLKMGIKMPRVVVFWTTSTMKAEKSAAKFHYTKTVSALNCLSSGVNILAGDDPFPLKSCLQVTCPLLSMVSYGRCQNS